MPDRIKQCPDVGAEFSTEVRQLALADMSDRDAKLLGLLVTKAEIKQWNLDREIESKYRDEGPWLVLQSELREYAGEHYFVLETPWHKLDYRMQALRELAEGIGHGVIAHEDKEGTRLLVPPDAFRTLAEE